MTPREAREAIDRAVAAIAPEVLSLAESIRSDPELSGSEHRAAERCAVLLASHGFEVDRGTAGLPTALRATRRIGSRPAETALETAEAQRVPGPQPAGRHPIHARVARVAFLAEYDALPGIGHGCGHHLIAASSVGAALAAALAANADDALELLVFGTPSEETIGGKVILAEAGVFDGLDGVLMFHAGHEWRTLTDSLACQSVEVIYGGKASHAVASPEAGVNALDAMIDLFLAMRRLRETFPGEIKIPGVILEGGVRANIVPDRAVARFTARAPSGEEREALVDALLSAVEEIARARGCRSLVRPVDNPYDEMRTSRTLAAILGEELRSRGAVVNDAPRQGKGSIDAGNVSRRAPAVHAYLPAAPRYLALHTREFGEATAGGRSAAALLTAVAAMAASALRLAREPGLREDVRAEFDAAPAPRRAQRWPLLTREPEERVEV